MKVPTALPIFAEKSAREPSLIAPPSNLGGSCVPWAGHPLSNSSRMVALLTQEAALAFKSLYILMYARKAD